MIAQKSRVAGLEKFRIAGFNAPGRGEVRPFGEMIRVQIERADLESQKLNARKGISQRLRDRSVVDLPAEFIEQRLVIARPEPAIEPCDGGVHQRDRGGGAMRACIERFDRRLRRMGLLVFQDRRRRNLTEPGRYLLPALRAHIARRRQIDLAADVWTGRMETHDLGQQLGLEQFIIRLDARGDHPEKWKEKEPRAKKQKRVHPAGAREVGGEAAVSFWFGCTRPRTVRPALAAAILTSGHNAPTFLTAKAARALMSARSKTKSTPAPRRTPSGNIEMPGGRVDRRKRALNCSARLAS